MSLAAVLPRAPALADQIQYLARPQESLAAFLSSIESARSTIEIANFTIEPCDASVQLLLRKLEAKAKQGVKVRMVIDDFEIPTEERAVLATNLAAAGIELRLFNDNPLTVNNRMHAKFMVVDGKSLITGGRNLGDSFFGVSKEFNYIDRDAWVRGGAAAQAGLAYRRLWSSPAVSLPQDRLVRSDPWRDFCRRQYQKDFTRDLKALETFMQNRSSEILARRPSRDCQNTRFYLDHPSLATLTTEGQACISCALQGTEAPSSPPLKQTTRELVSILESSRKSLVIENEAYIPVNELDQSLRRLRAKQVPVTVLTNRDMDAGPDFFRDVMAIQMANAAKRDSQGSQKVGQIPSSIAEKTGFELTPRGVPVYVHSKVAVSDNKNVVISSFNVDGRSANINVESMVVVKNCPALAADIRKEFEELQRLYRGSRKAGPNPAVREDDPFKSFLGDLFLPQL